MADNLDAGPMAGGDDVAPIVFARNGDVFANSRDVANFFMRRHDHVLRDIDALIKQGVPNFGETPYINEQNGQSYRSYDMDRDGFTLLAMGFTGPKALGWKLRYIEAFNAMEAELRDRPVAPDLDDPKVLLPLLMEYAQKRLEAEKKLDAAVLELRNAAAEISMIKPKAAIMEHLIEAHGSLTITNAAKSMGMVPSDLFRFLRQRGWVYRRAGTATDVAYQSRIATGLLEHKVTTIQRADGTEFVSTQVRVTAKGMARITAELKLGDRLVV